MSGDYKRRRIVDPVDLAWKAKDEKVGSKKKSWERRGKRQSKWYYLSESFFHDHDQDFEQQPMPEIGARSGQ